MLGRRWSDAEQGAYRSHLSAGRILDEAWILLSLVFFSMWLILDRIPSWVALPVWGVLGLLFYFVLGPRLLRLLPPHVRAVLPIGRFDGPRVPGAPRSYRELLRIWKTSVKGIPIG